MSNESDDRFEDYIALRSELRRSGEAHSAVEVAAFPRHFGVVVFYISLAWSLDIGFSIVAGFLSWLILRLFRTMLWEWGLHQRNLWNWLFFVRIIVFRWLVALVTTLIFWFRSPADFSTFWILPVGIIIVDSLLSSFLEGRGHLQADSEMAGLASEMNDLLKRSEESVSSVEIKQVESKSSSMEDLVQNNEFADDACQMILRYRDSVVQSETTELAKLRDDYAAVFDDWEEFVDSAIQRLRRTMKMPGLEHKVQQAIESDQDSVDSQYYIAAEDILFCTGMSQLPGADRAGVDAYRSWITQLLRKEFELKHYSQNSEARDQTNKFDQDKWSLAHIPSAVESLIKLRELGLLSDEEYEQKKRKLFDDL